MKRVALSLCLFLTVLAPGRAAVLDGRDTRSFIVHIAPGASAEAVATLHRETGAAVSGEIEVLDLVRIEVAPEAEWIYRRSPVVSWIEPEGTRTILDQPNDPLLSQQWSFDKLELNRAWRRETGANSPVTVAIVDSGIDLDHPDLGGRLVTGFDFVNNDELPEDDHGHGTHVGGVIAANQDNRIGIAGMSWGAKLMPIKACNADGACDDFAIVAAITFAALNGADVVNLSLGGPAPACPRSYRLAQSFADARGVVLVASSGNSAQSGNPAGYPAACDGFVGVGATDHLDRIAAFSDHGRYVDLSAPGTDIMSTVPFDSALSSRSRPGYGLASGTSMAAPHVSGLAALLVSAHPEWTPAEVVAKMKKTAKDRGPKGWDPFFGAGRIDVEKALARR